MGHFKKEDIEKLDAICEKYSMYPLFSQNSQSLEAFCHTMFLLTHIGVQIDESDFKYVEKLLELEDVREISVLFLNIKDLRKYISFEQASTSNFLWECGKTEVVVNSKPYYFHYLTDDGESYRFEGDVKIPLNDYELSEDDCKITFTLETRKESTGRNTNGWVLNRIIVG